MLFYLFFSLSAGSDVKNKDLSVYEFLLYEYLLSSLALHYCLHLSKPLNQPQQNIINFEGQ